MKNCLPHLVINFLLVSLLSSCNHKKACQSSVFSNTDNGIFLQKSETKRLRGACFNRYVLYTNLDSINCYWGIVNDTIFLLRSDYVNFPNPQFIPFLPLKAKAGQRYNYVDVIQSEDLVIPDDLIEVKILSVNYLDNDTVYTFIHNCIPSYDVTAQLGYITPIISREFTLSKNNGVLKCIVKHTGNTSDLKFHW